MGNWAEGPGTPEGQDASDRSGEEIVVSPWTTPEEFEEELIAGDDDRIGSFFSVRKVHIPRRSLQIISLC